MRRKGSGHRSGVRVSVAEDEAEDAKDADDAMDLGRAKGKIFIVAVVVVVSEGFVLGGFFPLEMVLSFHVVLVALEKKVKGAFVKPLFFLLKWSGLSCPYLLIPWSLHDAGSFVHPYLGFMVVLLVLHPEVSLVVPIEVGLSSMEGEMDVAGGDLSPIEVESDATKFSWKCYWEVEDSQLFGYMEAADCIPSIFFQIWGPRKTLVFFMFKLRVPC
ncbi:hypothetical protein SUGI_1116390 [Cryptomeria japonica]|nr:hypothetical protein SUGI_1116390 [Cryptomeria japonica]